MSQLISKILTLGGWFYISLALIAIFAVSIPKKVNDKLVTIILLSGSVLAIFISVTAIFKSMPQIELFFRSDRNKMETSTFNQYYFAQKIRETLNPANDNCVFWSWDIPTKYLIQEVYPIRLNTIWNLSQAKDCDFVISQFNPQPTLKEKQILIYKNNYIYNLMDH